jgi:Lon protease-like protein
LNRAADESGDETVADGPDETVRDGRDESEADGATIDMFPLSTVLFPGAPLTLRVFEPRYREMIAGCMEGSRSFGVVLIARGSEVGGGDERHDVGTLAHIEAAAASPDGRWALLVRGVRRIRVERWLDDDPFPRAVVAGHPSIVAGDGTTDDLVAGDTVTRARRSVARVHRLLSELGRPALSPTEIAAVGSEESDAATWRLCAMGPFTALDRQLLLEESDPVARLERLCALSDETAVDLERLLATGVG